MSDQVSQVKKPSEPTRHSDSFNVPVKKSPLFVYAMLQIPLVIFMVIMLYVLYHSQFS
jgi:hypothetical protein